MLEMNITYNLKPIKRLLSLHKKEWMNKAMNRVIDSLKGNATWILTMLPENLKAIPCKWVYRAKLNPEGAVDMYNTRQNLGFCIMKIGIYGLFMQTPSCWNKT